MKRAPIQRIGDATTLANDAVTLNENLLDYLERVEKFFLAFAGCSDYAEEGEDAVTIPLKRWENALRDFRAVV